jgi:hypothetical protein
MFFLFVICNTMMLATCFTFTQALNTLNRGMFKFRGSMWYWEQWPLTFFRV